jgi:hypothetical protein
LAQRIVSVATPSSLVAGFSLLLAVVALSVLFATRQPRQAPVAPPAPSKARVESPTEMVPKEAGSEPSELWKVAALDGFGLATAGSETLGPDVPLPAPEAAESAADEARDRPASARPPVQGKR